MNNIRFLLATKEELLALVHIEQTVTQTPWTAQQFQECILGDYAVWLIHFDTDVVGYVIFRVVLDECEIINIAIEPRFQRQGLGQQLLTFTEQQAAAQGCVKIFLEVRQSNHAAQGLYNKQGFQIIGQRKQYYPLVNGGREDAIQMVKSLPMRELTQ